MAYLWGLGLALAVAIFAATVGFDRDRSFYPVVLVVIASYYILFAVMQGSMPALGAEIIAFAAFALAAAAGFRWNLWIAAAALLGHGLFDFGHDLLIDNPGVPAWWPAWCLAYDAAAAACLAWIILSGRQSAKARLD
jgi:hypothetical protein